MKIKENSRLFLRDVYLYDIESCHYTIMKKLNFDMSGIDESNKLERNIQIGKMMRKNPSLTGALRGHTKAIIDSYINANRLRDDDIILRQYDGIIIKRTLRITDLGGIQLNIRRHFLNFIVSIDRNKYIALDSKGEVTIKGIPSRYSEMDKVYEQICKINYSNKESIFRNLQEIKNHIMTNKNTKLFAIPIEKNRFNIFLKEYGQVEVSKATLKIMDPDDIDREKYFNFYISPFTKSIVVEFVR
jgi:hypothetical protein